MNILVIGNGFDLAHGLQTTYKDFLNFCNKGTELDEIINGENEYSKCRKTNLWLKHFTTKQNELGETWIDLENEIYNVISYIEFETPFYNENSWPIKLHLDNLPNMFLFQNIFEYINKTNDILCVNHLGYKMCIDYYNNLLVYIPNKSGFIKFLYNQLREFTKLFEKYLREEVLNNLPKSEFQLNLNNQDNKTRMTVLSFNYTDTCEKLYKFQPPLHSHIKSVYVHGKVNSNSDFCNLVLGTHSFEIKRNENLVSMLPTEYNVFKKHNQRHKYNTIDAYQNFLDILNNSKVYGAPVFHVIGHSLDKTDHKILKHVFLANKNAKIKIYYHNEEAQERLINNVTEILGEEDVMTRVQFIYQYDSDRGLLLPKILHANESSAV